MSNQISAFSQKVNEFVPVRRCNRPPEVRWFLAYCRELFAALPESEIEAEVAALYADIRRVAADQTGGRQ